jgi:hypothetical protein
MRLEVARGCANLKVAMRRAGLSGKIKSGLTICAIALAALSVSGCSGVPTIGSSNGVFSISAAPVSIDTNCTGCNASTAAGIAVEQFSARLAVGGAADVRWSVSGGDSSAGAGTITNRGQYTPPSYLTADSVTVTVTAALRSDPSLTASASFTVTPGFLQPLTPENLALSGGETATITGYLAEAGGSVGIHFSLAGESAGSLGVTNCVRGAKAFTYCTVVYTAPRVVSASTSTYISAGIASTAASQSARILVNAAGISSNPATHQTLQSAPILLGSSGGNNNHYDAQGSRVSDCCGGTLGALIQERGGRQFLLSCNHVLARSDQASAGEMTIQPGLIDNSCTPNGAGSGTRPVGELSAWLPLNSRATNADAAIAQVSSRAVNVSGAILELGARQSNGAIAPAPPGISSSGGKGETASLNLRVAKSGRTTGLTCGQVSALDLDVEVDYYKDCGETVRYLTKTFTNQIAVEGSQFSDAGDSGALVVDAGNAEPVGLLFAGGVNSLGVTEAVATPAPTVLAALGARQGSAFTFVGAADHQVSCLSYGASASAAAQARTLIGAQIAQLTKALAQARTIVNSSRGIFGVAAGKSGDRPGEAAVIFYVDERLNTTLPQTIAGLRTEQIPTTARTVSSGAAPQSIAEAGVMPALSFAAFNQAVAIKRQAARELLRQNRAFFGIGVGQSFDNPREAALVVYVDRKQIPAKLPATIAGLRTRYIFMDRLHVTRSYLQLPVRQTDRCAASAQTDPLPTHALRLGNLF